MPPSTSAAEPATSPWSFGARSARAGGRALRAAPAGSGGHPRGDGRRVSVLTEAHLAYVERVEVRLAEAVGALQGTVATVSATTLRSGGKRLRPLLVHLAAPAGA